MRSLLNPLFSKLNNLTELVSKTPDQVCKLALNYLACVQGRLEHRPRLAQTLEILSKHTVLEAPLLGWAGWQKTAGRAGGTQSWDPAVTTGLSAVLSKAGTIQCEHCYSRQSGLQHYSQSLCPFSVSTNTRIQVETGHREERLQNNWKEGKWREKAKRTETNNEE